MAKCVSASVPVFHRSSGHGSEVKLGQLKVQFYTELVLWFERTAEVVIRELTWDTADWS